MNWILAWWGVESRSVTSSLKQKFWRFISKTFAQMIGRLQILQHHPQLFFGGDKIKLFYKSFRLHQTDVYKYTEGVTVVLSWSVGGDTNSGSKSMWHYNITTRIAYKLSLHSVWLCMRTLHQTSKCALRYHATNGNFSFKCQQIMKIITNSASHMWRC